MGRDRGGISSMNSVSHCVWRLLPSITSLDPVTSFPLWMKSRNGLSEWNHFLLCRAVAAGSPSPTPALPQHFSALQFSHLSWRQWGGSVWELLKMSVEPCRGGQICWMVPCCVHPPNHAVEERGLVPLHLSFLINPTALRVDVRLDGCTQRDIWTAQGTPGVSPKLNLRITESSELDPKRWSDPNPLHWKGTATARADCSEPRPAWPSLIVFRDGACNISLCNLFWCITNSLWPHSSDGNHPTRFQGWQLCHGNIKFLSCQGLPSREENLFHLITAPKLFRVIVFINTSCIWASSRCWHCFEKLSHGQVMTRKKAMQSEVLVFSTAKHLW